MKTEWQTVQTHPDQTAPDWSDQGLHCLHLPIYRTIMVIIFCVIFPQNMTSLHMMWLNL